MPTLPPFSSGRHRICLTCRDKVCCSYYTISVTAQDLSRIARALQLAPADFLTYYPVPEPEKGAFLLHPEGPWHVLTLARRPLPQETVSPCFFLVRTNDHQARCGLGDLKPGQCRVFPAGLADGFVYLVSEPAGCNRTWSHGDIDLEEERRRLEEFHREEAEYHRLVAEWNGRVRQGGRERSGEEFCAFLVNRTSPQRRVA